MTEAFSHQLIPEGLKDSPVAAFVQRYAQALQQPLVLLNHVGPIYYSSDEKHIKERESYLTKYLSNPFKASILDEGRALFSEIVFRQMLTVMWEPQLTARNLTLKLATTEIDESVYDPNFSNYQKGADICIIRPIDSTDGERQYKALCALDVTIAKKGTVRYKRKKPGIQLPTATPVLVIPLRKLTFGENNEFDFFNFLDRQAHDIAQGKPINPWSLLSDKERRRWQISINNIMQDGFAGCKKSLAETNDLRVLHYPYILDTIYQLHYVGDLIKECREQAEMVK